MTLPLISIRFILLISASFIAIFSSIAIYFCLPILISHVIRTQITLSANSGSYGQWRTNSITDRIYLFNITNLNELLSLEDSSITTTTTTTSPNLGSRRTRTRPVPRLSEIGPFTYRQDREKVNIKFDVSNETVIYDQMKTWQYLPEQSVSGTVDSLFINHINVPLVGTALNAEYAEFVDPVIVENDLRLFLNHSVGTLLFDGYYDILMEQAKASGQIDVDRFGWMHNQNGSLTKSIRIFTGPSNATLNKFGSIDEFGLKRQLQVWHNDNQQPNNFSDVKCNEFRFSSTGEFFPPPEYSFISHNHLSNVGSSLEQFTSLAESRKSKRKFISIFMPDLCRTLQLFYNGSHEHKGLLVDRYIANENTFKYWLDQDRKADGIYELVESNKCYCVYNETSRALNCPPNGMMDMFQCRKGSPVTISFPHFLYSQKDPTLRPFMRLFEIEQRAEGGMREEDYEFFIDLETTLNVPVNVQIVLQFNVHLKNEQQFNFTKEYAYLFEDPQENGNKLNDFYLPQMWIKSTAEIDENNLNNLIFIQKHLGLVTPLATIIIFGCASILLMASAKLAYDLTYGPKSRKSLACDGESCSSSSHQNHLCSSFIDEKKKYLDVQLLGKSGGCSRGGSSSHKNGCCNGKKSSSSNSKIMKSPFGHGNSEKEQLDCACNLKQTLNEPTTSKKAASQSCGNINSIDYKSNDLSNGANQSEESQPLNG